MTAFSLEANKKTDDAALWHWQPATWEKYCNYRDNPNNSRLRLFFDNDALLLLDMGWEGIEHAGFCDLFTMILGFWFAQHPEQQFTSLGRCLLEKEPLKAGASDLVLYLGEQFPVWEKGEKRRIDLNKWRVPNLVGEISDTTLTTDLDEKKRLYASLGIPEYWVIDVRGNRVFIFLLQGGGSYQPSGVSVALGGLSVDLLNQTIEKMVQESNGNAALWFAQQIVRISG
ncbi:MAG: Uma2 family endonuclease [Symploca sp. SIO2G7]|nr:Uma2 family endonuclease [Symploca sp. SIO2G7]